MPDLSISHRTRSTPFADRIMAAGAKAFTVYNHMLLPTVFRSIEEDYHHLKRAVQIWDVSCERQVELIGPDAKRLAQLMTPRDLSRQAIGKCLYTPICDANGHLLNDPVTIKLAEDRYWISVADSDVILFAKGLAAGLGLNVSVWEPEIFPVAVQGPKSDALMARVFGESITTTPFFGTQTREFSGRDHLIARSGYSGQGGYEIYVDGPLVGLELWDALMEAGQDLDVHAGCPNLIERIESGLLSYGNDISSDHTLAEAGLMRFCKTISPDCIANNALSNMGEPKRQLRYLSLDGDAMSPLSRTMQIDCEGQKVGQITSAVWSPDFATNVAIGMIDVAALGAESHLVAENGNRTVTVLTGPISMTQRKAA